MIRFLFQRWFVCRGNHLPLGGTIEWHDLEPAPGEPYLKARCYRCNKVFLFSNDRQDEE